MTIGVTPDGTSRTLVSGNGRLRCKRITSLSSAARAAGTGSRLRDCQIVQALAIAIQHADARIEPTLRRDRGCNLCGRKSGSSAHARPSCS